MTNKERLQDLRRRAAARQFGDTKTADDVQYLMSLVGELESALAPFARVATLPQDQNLSLVHCQKSDCIKALKLIEAMNQ